MSCFFYVRIRVTVHPNICMHAYVYMHVYICVCTHIHVHARITYVYVCMHMCLCMCMHVCICTCPCICIMHVCMCACMYVYVYVVDVLHTTYYACCKYISAYICLFVYERLRLKWFQFYELKYCSMTVDLISYKISVLVTENKQPLFWLLIPSI